MSETTDHKDEATELSRRDFLRWSWRFAGALAVGQGTIFGLRYIGSRQGSGVYGQVIKYDVKLRDIEPGTIAQHIQGRFYLIRFDNGDLLALHSKCTHLACLVSWDPDEGQFYCPCHGSEFTREGDVLNDPAPRPLDVFPIEIDDYDNVLIDTGNPIQRDEVSSDDIFTPPTPEPPEDADSAPDAGEEVTS
ncbi:MAG: ubiquinol-cytochrome c reductase iron-sulfur subunit [Chloroflexi bacterium]|nr:ubiquinol-cytochrome c reductase iron-sulfur subunit [Chloroflexota bacterium]